MVAFFVRGILTNWTWVGLLCVCFRRGGGYVDYDMSEVYVSGGEFIVLSFRTSKHMCPGLDGWQTRGVWIVVKCSKRTLRQTFFATVIAQHGLRRCDRALSRPRNRRR